RTRTRLRRVRLKLSFNGRLIYDGPDLENLFCPKFIKYIFGKADPLPIYWEAQELSLGRAIEEQAARHMGWIADQQYPRIEDLNGGLKTIRICLPARCFHLYRLVSIRG